MPPSSRAYFCTPHHPALRRLSRIPGPRYDQRTPALSVGLTDHRWTWHEFLTMHVSITT
jgi:hypothetical protein